MPSRSPVRVPSLTDVIDIDAGGDVSCALRRGGQLCCWGRDDNDQLSDWDTWPLEVPHDERFRPTPVCRATSFVEVQIGGGYVCGTDSAGRP